ncbi:MAG TPA: hypothetical protein VGA53_00605 [Candidatus Paceibacterota bacterium]
MSAKLSALIKENKHVGGFVRYDDGSVVRGNFIERIFEQGNGKLCYILSKKVKPFSNEEKVVYLAEDMEDENHINALLATGENPFVNLFVPPYVRSFNNLLNSLERILPNKAILLLIIILIILFFR